MSTVAAALAGAAAAAAASSSSAVAPSAAPLPLGPHLLAASPLLASAVNATLTLGTVAKLYDAPVVTGAGPWERSVGFYSSAVTCPAAPPVPCGAPGFRVYYVCGPAHEQAYPVTLCVATSPDGVNWTKPALPFFSWDGSAVVPAAGAPPGSSPTNAVFQTNDTVSFPGAVMLDPTPTVPAAERYKLVYEGAGGTRLLYLSTSPDGFAWTPPVPDESPIIPVRLFSDTEPALLVTQTPGGPVYTALGRADETTDNDTAACPGAYPALRRVLAATAEGSAAGPYSPPAQIIVPGDPDVAVCLDDYNPAPVVVAGVTFFLVSNFWHFSVNASGATGASNRINDGIMDIRLAFTRADPPTSGVDFHASRGAFIPRGVGYRDPATGIFNLPGSAPDAGFVFATAGGLLDPDAVAPPPSASPSTPAWPLPFTAPSPTVSLLYWGGQVTHTGGGRTDYPTVFTGVLRATVRREGLVGLSTPPGDPWSLASAVTVPVAVPPPSACPPAAPHVWLLLNAETSAGGFVTVELRDAASGTPVPGYADADAIPVKGNAIRAPVSWVRPAGGGVADPPVPAPAAFDLGPPSANGTRPLVVAFTLKHATLWAWDVQCVAV
jgi:hypothetical protein